MFCRPKIARVGTNYHLLNRDIKPGGLAEYGIYPTKTDEKAAQQFTKVLGLPTCIIRHVRLEPVCCSIPDFTAVRAFSNGIWPLRAGDQELGCTRRGLRSPPAAKGLWLQLITCCRHSLADSLPATG